MITTHQIARAFTALCKEGKLAEAGQQFWSDDIVSIEAFPGEHAIQKGRVAVLEKQAQWGKTTTVHGMQVQGPFLNGEQFAVRFSLDCTGPDGKRGTMEEVALYTVANGAVAEERFFFAM